MLGIYKQSFMSTIALSSLRFCFATELKPIIAAKKEKIITGLNRKQIARHFQNPNEALKRVQQIQAKYPEFNRRETARLFKIRPKIFIPGHEQNKQFLKRIELINSFQDYIKKPLYRISGINFYVMASLTEQQLNSFANTVKEFNIKEEQLDYIIRHAFNVVHHKFSDIMHSKYKLFDEYLHFTKEKFIDVMAHSPFLLPASEKMIKQSIMYFLNGKVPIESIEKLMKQLGEVFLIGKQNLRRIQKQATDVGVDYKDFWKQFLAHPLLFMNDPQFIMPKKMKIMKLSKFDKQMVKCMYLKHPASLIWSVRSLQAKIIFLTQRLGFKINPVGNAKKQIEYQFNPQHFVQILTYKFQKQIRPRGQILARIKQKVTPLSFIQDLKLTDQEFVTKYRAKNQNLTMERYIQQIDKYKVTDEIDYRIKKSLRLSHRNRVIKQKSKQYQKNIS